MAFTGEGRRLEGMARHGGSKAGTTKPHRTSDSSHSDLSVTDRYQWGRCRRFVETSARLGHTSTANRGRKLETHTARRRAVLLTDTHGQEQSLDISFQTRRDNTGGVLRAFCLQPCPLSPETPTFTEITPSGALQSTTLRRCACCAQWSHT